MLLIDMWVPTDNNVSVKEFNTINKYKNLEIETENIWHFKITAMLVIVGVLGMIKKWTDKH